MILSAVKRSEGEEEEEEEPRLSAEATSRLDRALKFEVVGCNRKEEKTEMSVPE